VRNQITEPAVGQRLEHSGGSAMKNTGQREINSPP